jgi:hypothetical protein
MYAFDKNDFLEVLWVYGVFVLQYWLVVLQYWPVVLQVGACSCVCLCVNVCVSVCMCVSQRT